MTFEFFGENPDHVYLSMSTNMSMSLSLRTRQSEVVASCSCPQSWYPAPSRLQPGVLSLLDEPDPVFKQHALNALNPLVPQFWSEISEHISTMSVVVVHSAHPQLTPLREAIYENTELPKQVQEAAALLASKVFYYLAEYDEAVSFALGAGSAFRAEADNAHSAEYVETIICALLRLAILVPHVFVQRELLTVTLKSLQQTRRPMYAFKLLWKISSTDA